MNPAGICILNKTTATNPESTLLLQDPRMLLAFGFGSGLSRVMPGTMGTLAAIPLFLLLAMTPLWLYVTLVTFSAILGIYLCGYAANKLQVHDHPGIVWDEFVGFWLCMLAMPVNWKTVLVGFVLFRIFDMLKPWPISLADKHIHGGVGIMFDDILAGIAAWLCMFALIYFGVL